METNSRIIENLTNAISQTTTAKAYLFTDDKLEETHYGIITVAFENIFMLVKPKHNASLKKSIEASGLKDPLILIPNSEKNYEMAIRGVKKDLIEEQKEAPFLCYAGNQRMTALKELGYLGASCIIADDVHWAHSVHLVLQDGVIINESS